MEMAKFTFNFRKIIVSKKKKKAVKAGNLLNVTYIKLEWFRNTNSMQVTDVCRGMMCSIYTEWSTVQDEEKDKEIFEQLKTKCEIIKNQKNHMFKPFWSHHGA